MKKTLTALLLILAAAVLFVSCDTDGSSGSGVSAKYKIGDKGPGGGIVFYDAKEEMTSTYKDSNGNDVTYKWRYLEAAPGDISGTCYFGWYSCMQYDVGGTSGAIGAGRMNTSIIYNAVTDSKGAFYGSNVSDTDCYGNSYAVYQASNYRNPESTIYTDWFLPSTEELDLVYENLKKADIGTWQNAKYWTSVECGDRNNAVAVDFSTGEDSTTGRTNSTMCYVRPIRAFLE